MTFAKMKFFHGLLKVRHTDYSCVQNCIHLYSGNRSIINPDGLPKRRSDDIECILNNLLQHKRSGLAEAITLIESVHPLKKRKASQLLSLILKYWKENHNDPKTSKSFRIGKYLPFEKILLYV